MNTYRFSGVRAIQVLGLLLLGSMAAHAQITNFVDDFDGPTLDPGWVVEQPSNHVGFTGTSLYEMEAPNAGAPTNSASLERALGATNEDFTVDVTFEIDDSLGHSVDYKLRFWSPAFLMEVVANPQSDNIRVFSVEQGTLGSVSGVGLGDGVSVRLRVNYDASAGAVEIGYALGTDPLVSLGYAVGLTQFDVTEIDLNVTGLSFGNCPPFCWIPRMFLDRFEIRDEVVPVTFAYFEDHFSGPVLDPSWDTIQPGEHVGFISGGLYEVKKTSTSGEAGLSRDFGGQGDFYSTVEFQMQDFIGSDARVEFRHPSAGNGLTVVLDSTGNVQVVSEELASTVATLTSCSYQDGETVKFSVSSESATGFTEVGMQREGGYWRLLASLTNLTLFTPTNSQTVVIKSGTGNGNSPRLLFDHYLLDNTFAAVPVEAFVEYFTGPALDVSWFTSDTGTGSLVGFNEMGQYEISTASNATAGLSRCRLFAGNATFTLTARLVDFIGTDSELRLALTGADPLTVVLRSNGDVEVFDDLGSTYGPAATGISDGDLVTIQLTIEAEFGDWELGLGINGDPEFVALGLGIPDLNPTHTEIEVARGSGGSQPSILLDQFSVIEGFALVPQAAERYSDDFNSGPLDGGWNVVDGGDAGTHPGYTNSQWYAIQITTNGTVINLNRLLAPSGVPGVPVGSFSASLDVRLDEFAGLSSPGAGTDLKFRITGGNSMEIFFNTFKDVKLFAQGNGGVWHQETISDFNDGDTVNLGIVYDASGPSVTMSLGLNGTNLVRETRSNLVGVAPEGLVIQGYRFNTDNPGLVPTFLLDQLDINPGLAGVEPGALTLEPAYNGLYEITWDLGELQSAPEIDGTYSNVMWATSPYLMAPSEDSEFFRAEN